LDSIPLLTMKSATTFYSLLILLSSCEGFRRSPCEIFHRPIITVRGGGSSSYPDTTTSSYKDDENDPPLDHETVQERVNAWRKYQQVTKC
jgi:hypothetical protein